MNRSRRTVLLYETVIRSFYLDMMIINIMFQQYHARNHGHFTDWTISHGGREQYTWTAFFFVEANCHVEDRYRNTNLLMQRETAMQNLFPNYKNNLKYVRVAQEVCIYY
jgi:cbb3-type cytochrome oxidase subunit 1